MAIRKMWHLCMVQLKELFFNPTTYAFMGLLFVYFFHFNSPTVRFLNEANVSLNAWGYTACTFSKPASTLVFGLGCMALFADLPLIRENALFESTRCSRNVWVGGRIIYVLIVSFFYSFLMLTFCLLTSGGSLSTSASWGKVLNTLANGYVIGGVELPVFINLNIINNYVPLHAWLLTLGMCIGASSFLGMFMLCMSLTFDRIPALLCTGAFAILDFVISEKLPYWMYRMSPLSYTRLEIIASPDMSYYPSLPEAVLTLTVALTAVTFISTFVSHRSKAFSSKILAEQY